MYNKSLPSKIESLFNNTHYHLIDMSQHSLSLFYVNKNHNLSIYTYYGGDVFYHTPLIGEWEILCYFISQSFSFFIYDNSEACKTGKCSVYEYKLMNSQYSPAIMHSNIFRIIDLEVCLRLIMRNIMLFRLYNHSSSSYSSMIVVWGTTCEYERMKSQQYF